MNNDWESQIDKLIQESNRKLELIKLDREERMNLKVAKAREIKDVLLPKLKYVLDIYKKNTSSLTEVLDQELPFMTESEFEFELNMPQLSEVNKMNLRYTIEFDTDDNAILHAFNVYSVGKTELVGSTGNDYPIFIENSIKYFMINWYKRKRGDELFKEQEVKLKISSKSI